MTRRARALHRGAALIVGTFTVLHLFNHLLALGGVDLHIRVMAALRLVYRHPVVEVLLLAAILVQVVSGLGGLRNAWGRRGIPRWQALSGAWLGLFLIGHTTAVMVGRYAWHVDTNFYFAAAPLQTGWLPMWFVPYYGAGVLAVGAHLGAVAFWRLTRGRQPRVFTAAVAVGAIAAVLIVATFAGLVTPTTIPAAYTDNYAWAR